MIATNDDVARLTATDLAARLTSGALSAETVARACLARVDARDDDVKAWVHVDRDLVIAEARALDAAAADGHRGPLFGIPVGIKDIILTHDQPTRYNSPLYPDFHPRIDATCVALLRDAGALIFGKTDTVEFGATGRKAATRNPHALTHTPGGSSSGSAAAVADRHVPLALGTQTGGSMLRPASYCGAWGFKPTWGLVSNEGARRYAASLDTLGWFARSCDDLALLLDVFDPDWPRIERPTTPFDLAGARIGVHRTAAWQRAEPATVAAMTAATDGLRRAGATLVEIDAAPPLDRLPDLQMLIMRSEARAALLAEYRLHPDALDASLRDQVLNTDGTSRDQLVEAYDVAAQCRVTFDRIANEVDAILAPSTTGSAPPGLTATGDLIFNGLWTLLHVPCVNVPGWQDAGGLPVGLTLVGPRFADRRLLAVARAVGLLFPGQTAVR